MTFGAEFAHIFRMLEVGGFCARLFYHPGEFVFVIEQGAGPEHVLIKRLPRLIGFKKRALQSL